MQIEIPAYFLATSKVASKKRAGQFGWYSAVSIGGRGKRIYTQFQPALQLEAITGKDNEFTTIHSEPVSVILVCEVGGYGESLGLDVKEIKIS